jgi:cytochrome P450
MWVGPKPRVFIMDPEQIKDILTKAGLFRKPHINPLSRLLALGVVAYEGEKWAKHRKIINPAFRIEKLKVNLF